MCFIKQSSFSTKPSMREVKSRPGRCRCRSWWRHPRCSLRELSHLPDWSRTFARTDIRNSPDRSWRCAHPVLQMKIISFFFVKLSSFCGTIVIQMIVVDEDVKGWHLDFNVRQGRWCKSVVTNLFCSHTPYQKNNNNITLATIYYKKMSNLIIGVTPITFIGHPGWENTELGVRESQYLNDVMNELLQKM